MVGDLILILTLTTHVGSSSFKSLSTNKRLSTSAIADLEADNSGALEGQLWVFDRGYWAKNRTLWENVQSAQWDNVILGEEVKKRLREDVEDFFDREQDYKGFAVPWKVSN